MARGKPRRHLMGQGRVVRMQFRTEEKRKMNIVEEMELRGEQMRLLGEIIETCIKLGKPVPKDIDQEWKRGLREWKKFKKRFLKQACIDLAASGGVQ